MIKKIPVCPFCNSEMEKVAYFVDLPTKQEIPYILLTNVPHEPPIHLQTESGDTARVFTDFLVYSAWTCGQCGFVALFDGGPK